MKLLYIDLFCGAGGTSTGVEAARYKGRQCAKVIACVNHDANAIASHAANHPEAQHYTEDMRTLDLHPLKEHTAEMRQMYPMAKIVLWASLECTNFSRAKGGQPRDADSRTLAEHLFRYIEALNADYIQIENVEEFMSWGDLDENGKPISQDAGRLYRQWVANVCGYGYRYDYRILNSADFGAYTSRRRLFGIFAKEGLPIAWPEPTHSKEGTQGLFGGLKRWRAVREVLDFSDEGESIFGRRRPLVEATLERIYAGLIKFVAGGNKAPQKERVKCKKIELAGKAFGYVYRYDDDMSAAYLAGLFVEEKERGRGIGTELMANLECIVASWGVRTLYLWADKNSWMHKWYMRKGYTDCAAFVGDGNFVWMRKTIFPHRERISFLAKYFSGNPEGKCISVEGPAGAVTARDHHSFITAYYGGNGHNHSIDAPAPTLTTKDRLAFVDMQYGNGKPCNIDTPAGAVTTNPKHRLVTCLRSTSAQVADGGAAADSPAMAKIKEFMDLYGIVDIRMRMLRVGELKRIMGFPSDYTLVGSQADQKKFIGNAVEVNMARALCEALATGLFPGAGNMLETKTVER